MKVKDIAKQYGIDNTAFSNWLKSSGHSTKSGVMGGLDLADGQDVAGIVGSFKAFQAQEQERISRQKADEQNRLAREKADRERAALEKQQALASMLITSGFNFDGYTITKYSGYISGDDAVSMDRPSQGYWGSVKGNVGGDLLAALVHIRRNALAELKEAAYALGCNAVIGVDFDYLTLDPETATNQGGTLYLPFLFAVTANGNAVVIEKSNRTGLT
jgi:uncharacterized protein YbjQ (UPF0145 family)